MLAFRLSYIYGIVDTATLSGMTPEEAFSILADAGLNVIQLRHKGTSREFTEIAISLAKLAAEYDARFIVNDRPDIALISGAHGVHLGQTDLPPAEARKLLGEKAIVGYSTHTIEQLRAAKSEPVDYIAFGPIFQSRTKQGHATPVGLELLTLAKQICGKIPLTAIGGINARNIFAVLSAGADSAAVISEIFGAPEPKKMLKRLVKIASGVSKDRRFLNTKY